MSGAGAQEPGEARRERRAAPVELYPARSWFAYLCRMTLKPACWILYRMRVLGRENIPAGGAILAGNHRSYIDPPVLWSVVRWGLHFMGKAELYRKPFFAYIFTRVGSFPVNRGAPDREALAVATAFLENGEMVGIFPEGTRNRDGDSEGQRGAAFLAMRAGVPVVPVGIDGTDRIKPPGSRSIHFPRVTICFGEPIEPEAFAHLDRHGRLDAMTAAIMEGIAVQLERAKEAGAS